MAAMSSLVVALAVLLMSALSASAQNCTTLPTCPSSAVTVPSPWFNLTFDSQIPSSVPLQYYSSYNDSCGFSHQGVVGFTGGVSGTNVQYIDLVNASSPNSAGAVLPGNIGGTSSGSYAAGTAGWTFELTFQAGQQTDWAKLMMFGFAPYVSDIQFEWNAATYQIQFTTYDVTQLAGYDEMIPNTNLNQWYHMVMVVEQITPTIATAAKANWYGYVNGQLVSNVYSQAPLQWYPQNTSRPSGYLGRSIWNGDTLFVGLMDSFRIYDYALTQSQVQALTANALAGCSSVTWAANPSTPSAIFPNNPLSQATAAPTPVYDLEFATNPTNVSPPGFQWLAQDQDDVQCGLNSYHQGLVFLQDETQVTENDNIGPFTYIDLASTTSPESILASASTPAGPMSPTLLGSTVGTLAAGTKGFSMEITFKPMLTTQWAKIIDFGSTRNISSTTCNNDIVFGYDNVNNYMQLEVCDTFGNNAAINNVGNGLENIVSGYWYHAVIVFQTLDNGNSDWYVFMNNVLVSTLSNSMTPQPVVRQNLWLGRSGWGDTLWSGEIDNFRVYNTALSIAQVNTLFVAAMGAAGQLACPYTASTSSVIPTSAVFFSATFATNPNTLAAVGSTTNYSWSANDTSDVVAGVHTGILVLNGCTAGNCAGNYVNLSQATGPTSIGQVLPSWGGVGTGSFDQQTVGWTFEVTWKAYSQQTWAKIFDLGDGTPGGNEGVWDVLLGWNAGNQYMTVTTTDLYNFETSVSQATPIINLNTWYHTVWVIQSTPGSTTSSSGESTSAANFLVYTNGVLTGSAYGGVNNGNPNTYYPPLVRRSNQNLGKSNWGDDFFLGEIDTFRVYSIALNQNQVSGLWQAASAPPGATNFSCVGAGFDMSSVGYQDYSITYGGYSWIVHPCGYIQTGTCAPGASFCQNNNVVSYYEPTLNPVLWTRIEGGVQISITDGAQCGTAAYGRTGIVRFLCSETAIVPYLSQVLEVVTCTYVAVILTASACQPATNASLITAVNEPFASPVCGGGLFDLSSLNNQDLAYNASNGAQYWFRPCAAVSQAQCSCVQPVSFCQSGCYAVANYAPATSPTVYTLTQTTTNGVSTPGLLMQIADGTVCAGEFPRVGILQFVCDPTATTPVVVSVVESPIIFCHYTATVRTNAVCSVLSGSNNGLTGSSQRAPTVSQAGLTAGYVPTCSGAGFDVSQSNVDMFYISYGAWTYYLHPCGAIQGTNPCGGQTSMCQVSSDGTSSNVASVWNSSLASLAQWVAMPNGVQMTIATGAGCGTTAVNRYAVYNFICDTSAIYPQLSYVYEIEECHYEAYIATAQACTQYTALLGSNANVGATFFSGTCGGGVYPLSKLSGVEMYQNATASSPFSYYVRVCSQVVNSACAGAQPTSFCQYQGQPPAVTLPYSVDYWSASNPFNQWTVTSNGITLQVQDGTACPAIDNAVRTAIYQFVCNATATTPYLTVVEELEVCHYTAIIQTAYACPQYLLLSTGVPAVAVSSSSSTGVSVVSTPTSSSSAGVSVVSTAGSPVVVGGASSSSGSVVVVTTTTTSNSLSGGKLAAAIVVPIIGAVLLALLIGICCYSLGRSSASKRFEKHVDQSRNTAANTDEASRASHVEMGEVQSA